ncbi:MAG: HNH endonuclease signature motif containing protein, partial [Oligoflexia bacterium]|nr:HNH endonuclease signature motif containing protein [Oligoflexia bacterium]
RAERQEEKVKNDAPSPDIRLKTEHSRQTETQEATKTKEETGTKTDAKTRTQSDFREILFQNTDIPFQRSSIPTQLKRQVILRDKDKCQHRYYDGSKCENQRFIEIHHKIPISHGGQNQIQNLTTLCSGHHKAQHIES